MTEVPGTFLITSRAEHLTKEGGVEVSITVGVTGARVTPWSGVGEHGAVFTFGLPQAEAKDFAVGRRFVLRAVETVR